MSILQKYDYYCFEDLLFNKSLDNIDYSNGFVFKIKLNNYDLPLGRKVIFSCPFFQISTAKIHVDDKESFIGTETNDNVFIYADEDGFVSLLEVASYFQSKYDENPRQMIIDLPLKLFDFINKEVFFLYNKVVFGFIMDGELVNINYPFGNPISYFENSFCDASLDFNISKDVEKIVITKKQQLIDKDINYYSPRGYNVWCGDVVNFYHNGVYHLMYLRDRHHHGSRWGSGAHSMYHLTTKDFISWEEQPCIAPLDTQWKTIGTGTMFFYKGKYYLSHGWHTSRNIPNNLLASTLLKHKFDTTATFEGVSYKELNKLGLIPNGATYEISDDGINFYPSNMQIHVAENPTILVKDNKLNLVAGYGFYGLWESNDLNGPWLMKSKKSVPDSIMNPTDECPSMFSKNGYNYIVMGGTGYWRTEKDSNVFIDKASMGEDVYDGLVYPMVTKTDEERLIIGGWINGYGWGSVIVHRELIQGENGRLYMKWLDEISPNKSTLEKLDFNNQTLLNPTQSYYLEFDVKSNDNSKVIIRFIGESDAVLFLDSFEKSIQVSKMEKDKYFPDKIKPVYVIANENVGKDWKGEKNVPKESVDFSIANVDFLDNDYKVKLKLYYEKKFDSVIIDAEIGGKRTIVSNRVRQKFNQIKFETLNSKIDNLEVFKM